MRRGVGRLRGGLGRSQVKRPVVVALALAVLVAGGPVAVWFSVANLAYAARWTGTPGLFTVQACERLPGRQGPRTECTGVFRADNGGPVRLAQMSQPLAAGAVVPVQRTAGDGYVRVGVSAVCTYVTETLFGVAVSGTGLMSLWSIGWGGRGRLGWVVILAAVAAALVSAVVAAIAAAVE